MSVGCNWNIQDKLYIQKIELNKTKKYQNTFCKGNSSNFIAVKYIGMGIWDHDIKKDCFSVECNKKIQKPLNCRFSMNGNKNVAKRQIDLGYSLLI